MWAPCVLVSSALVVQGLSRLGQAALFAFNHSAAYVSDVLSWAARYAAGGAQAVSAAGSAQCQLAAAGPLPAGAAGKVIAYAEASSASPTNGAPPARTPSTAPG